MASMQERIYQRSPAWLQNVLVSAYGYRLYRKRYSGIYHEIRDLLRQSRHWSQEKTESWQAEKLHDMVRHCRLNVPYYQELFAEHGLHEHDFTSAEDVRKIPILTKAILRQDTARFRSGLGNTYMTQHTSGSTGTPLALEVDEYTYKLAMALLVEHEEYHGIPFGAKRATFAGRMVQPAEQLTPPFARFNKAENQMIYSSYHLNSDTFPWYAKALDSFRPLELIGYPSAISDLAFYYMSTGIKPNFEPKAVISNSETLLDWQREKIEHVFNCPVRDYYGTAEYVLFAGQNNDGDYRINPIIGITEILDEQGDPSHEGRLIATSLVNKVMPLLRYEVGDSAISPENRHSMHSVTRSLERINGRLDDYIELPDGRRLGRLDHIFKGIEGLIEAQIVQDSPSHCTINTVFSSASRTENTDRLKANFNSRTGHQMNVTIRSVAQLSRGPNGKFRNVIRSYDQGEKK